MRIEGRSTQPTLRPKQKVALHWPTIEEGPDQACLRVYPFSQDEKSIDPKEQDSSVIAIPLL